jgi:hypothetical protein
MHLGYSSIASEQQQQQQSVCCREAGPIRSAVCHWCCTAGGDGGFP